MQARSWMTTETTGWAGATVASAVDPALGVSCWSVSLASAASASTSASLCRPFVAHRCATAAARCISATLHRPARIGIRAVTAVKGSVYDHRRAARMSQCRAK